MVESKSTKAITLATMAIGISSVIQGFAAFQQFSNSGVPGWAHVSAVVGLGILALISLSLAWKAFEIGRN